MTWVSVKERLPDTERHVLVLGHKGDQVVMYMPKGRKDAWYPGGWGIEWTTHWMELPEPPNAT